MGAPYSLPRRVRLNVSPRRGGSHCGQGGILRPGDLSWDGVAVVDNLMIATLPAIHDQPATEYWNRTSQNPSDDVV